MQKRGFEFLRQQLQRAAGERVVVERDGVRLFETTAVIAKTSFEDIDGEGRRLTSYIDDFVFDGRLGYRPKAGDIYVALGDRFKARILGDELWRWEDPYNTQLRVHAMKIKG